MPEAPPDTPLRNRLIVAIEDDFHHDPFEPVGDMADTLIAALRLTPPEEIAAALGWSAQRFWTSGNTLLVVPVGAGQPSPELTEGVTGDGQQCPGGQLSDDPEDEFHGDLRSEGGDIPPSTADGKVSRLSASVAGIEAAVAQVRRTMERCGLQLTQVPISPSDLHGPRVVDVRYLVTDIVQAYLEGTDG